MTNKKTKETLNKIINMKYKSKRKNPTIKAKRLAESVFGSSVTFVDEGYDGEVYKNQNLVIKIFGQPCTKTSYLLKLSDNKLIPHIYEITNKYMVMEYIEGETLVDIINNNPSPVFSYEEIPEIMLKIKKELKKWHAKEFTHGDITLGNIMIDKNNKIVLLDPKLEKTSKQEDLEDLKDLEIELLEYAG